MKEDVIHSEVLASARKRIGKGKLLKASSRSDLTASSRAMSNEYGIARTNSSGGSYNDLLQDLHMPT